MAAILAQIHIHVVGALAWFNFELEYQKGYDNTVADVLSQVTTWLDPETVKSILNGVALGTEHCAEVHDPAIVEGNQCLQKTSMHCHRLPLGGDTCYHLGQIPERGPNVGHSVGLAEGTEADWFEGASGRTHLQWWR